VSCAGVAQIIVDNDQARVKDGLPVEAHITAGLSHVNVVRTIAHAWRPLSSHVSASMSVWDSAGSALGPASCSDGETWLLLELCDRGTLQVGCLLPKNEVGCLSKSVRRRLSHDAEQLIWTWPQPRSMHTPRQGRLQLFEQPGRHSRGTCRVCPASLIRICTSSSRVDQRKLWTNI